MRLSWFFLGSLLLAGCELPACQQRTQTPTSASVAPQATSAAPPTPSESARREPARPASKVINLQDGWPEKRFTKWDGDKSPAVAKVCQALVAKHDALVRKVTENHAHLVANVDVCFPSAQGAWYLEDSGLKKTPPKNEDNGNEEDLEIDVALVYITPEGKTVRSKAQMFIGRRNINEINDIDVEGLFDYDGDGVSEVALTTSNHFGSEDRTEKTMLYSLKKGEVVEYKPTSLPFAAMRDVDDDGRPDLILKSPFIVDAPCTLDGNWASGPTPVAHSLPNGEFSMNDAIAKEVVRVQCGPSPKELMVLRKEGQNVTLAGTATMLRLVCAKFYGASTDELAGRIRKAYPYPHEADDSEPQDGPGTCFPLKSMIKLATQTPPFTVEPPSNAE